MDVTNFILPLTDLALQNGQSALCYLSSAGETEFVKLLLKYGAQVDVPVSIKIDPKIVYTSSILATPFCVNFGV